MSISINQYNQEWICRKMESGLYPSADDVISTALGLLERLDPDVERELADMRESVKRSTQQADKGILIPGHVVFDEIRHRNAEMMREKRANKAKQ